MTNHPNRSVSAKYGGALGPLEDVVGVSKSHGDRAVRWLRDHRSMLSYYDADHKTLRAPVTKHGVESTRKAMELALEETR